MMLFLMKFSSKLAYKSQHYSEAMDLHLYVLYTTYATSSKEKTGDIITFTHFEEGDLWSDTRDNAESVDESDDNSIVPPLIIKEEIDAIYYGDESEDEPMYT